MPTDVRLVRLHSVPSALESLRETMQKHTRGGGGRVTHATARCCKEAATSIAFIVLLRRPMRTRNAPVNCTKAYNARDGALTAMLDVDARSSSSALSATSSTGGGAISEQHRVTLSSIVSDQRSEQ